MWALAWLFLAALPATSRDDAVPGAALVFVGQVSRLDLVDGSVWLRLDGRAAERRIRVDPEHTRLVRDGRAVRPEDVEPGERAIAVCEEVAPGAPRALLLKLGPSRRAAR